MQAANLFDEAFLRRSRGRIRPETDQDEAFLDRLFVACSPLAAFLPEPVLRQQAAMQRRAHTSSSPQAMRRIVLVGTDPVARMVIDWAHPSYTHGVDIAVMPQSRKTGVGWHLLQAWIEAADRIAKPCRLEVLTNNPARKIYTRLGFREISASDPTSARVDMQRPAALSGRA